MSFQRQIDVTSVLAVSIPLADHIYGFLYTGHLALFILVIKDFKNR